MQFRKEQVDEIKIVEGHTESDLIGRLNNLSKDYIFIDIQYAITYASHYSALVLLRRKS